MSRMIYSCQLFVIEMTGQSMQYAGCSIAQISTLACPSRLTTGGTFMKEVHLLINLQMEMSAAGKADGQTFHCINNSVALLVN